MVFKDLIKICLNFINLTKAKGNLQVTKVGQLQLIEIIKLLLQIKDSQDFKIKGKP